MATLSEDSGLGDYPLDQPYQTPSAERAAAERVRVVPGIARGIPGVPSDFRWVADVPWSRSIRRTFGVTPSAAIRVDAGLTRRSLIVLQNIGDNGLWYDFGHNANNVSVNNGGFLPGSPVAGAHLGGIVAIGLSENVEVWVIADTPGNTSVTVMEFGI